MMLISFLCLIAISISSLEKHLFKSLANFKKLFFCLFLSCQRPLHFCIQIPYQIYDLQIFSPFAWFYFHFFDVVLQGTNIFNIDDIQIYLFLKIYYLEFCPQVPPGNPFTIPAEAAPWIPLKWCWRGPALWGFWPQVCKDFNVPFSISWLTQSWR